MPIARITSHGLAAIALLVAVLWGCILAENSIRRSAIQVRADWLNELRLLRSGLHQVKAPRTIPALHTAESRRA
jgi:hypothetical protein